MVRCERYEYSPIGQMRNLIEFLPLQKVGGQVLAMLKGVGAHKVFGKDGAGNRHFSRRHQTAPRVVRQSAARGPS